MRGQLQKAECGAEPGAGEGSDDEREGIPVRAEGRDVIPGGDGSNGAGDESNDAADQSVKHRSIGGEAGDKVTPEDAEDDAIGGGQHEKAVGHGLAERRIDVGGVEEGVGEERRNDAGQDTEGYGGDALAGLPARGRFGGGHGRGVCSG